MAAIIYYVWLYRLLSLCPAHLHLNLAILIVIPITFGFKRAKTVPFFTQYRGSTDLDITGGGQKVPDLNI